MCYNVTSTYHHTEQIWVLKCLGQKGDSSQSKYNQIRRHRSRKPERLFYHFSISFTSLYKKLHFNAAKSNKSSFSFYTFIFPVYIIKSLIRRRHSAFLPSGHSWYWRPRGPQSIFPIDHHHKRDICETGRIPLTPKLKLFLYECLIHKVLYLISKCATSLRCIFCGSNGKSRVDETGGALLCIFQWAAYPESKPRV